MNLSEAHSVIDDLSMYQGKVMKPFLAPVSTFIIVPATQHEFDAMFKNMQHNDTFFDEAIKPYKDNVTILVCFDVPVEEEGTKYCLYDYFCRVNNLLG